MASCVWTPDDDGVYETGCGQAHMFEDGGPSENHYRFCPYCGYPLAQKCSICMAVIPADSPRPLCGRCEATARAHAKYEAAALEPQP